MTRRPYVKIVLDTETIQEAIRKINAFVSQLLATENGPIEVWENEGGYCGRD